MLCEQFNKIKKLELNSLFYKLIKIRLNRIFCYLKTKSI